MNRQFTIPNFMKLAKIDVHAEWDAEAKVWVASSEDMPRLVTEADTLEELQQKLAVMIPELLEANSVLAENDIKKIPVNLIAHLAMIGMPRASASLPARGLRERELGWRRTHAETLRQFENEWVVLEGEDIIAHGADAAQVIREAKSRGIKTPTFFSSNKNLMILSGLVCDEWAPLNISTVSITANSGLGVLRFYKCGSPVKTFTFLVLESTPMHTSTRVQKHHCSMAIF